MCALLAVRETNNSVCNSARGPPRKCGSWYSRERIDTRKNCSESQKPSPAIVPRAWRRFSKSRAGSDRSESDFFASFSFQSQFQIAWLKQISNLPRGDRFFSRRDRAPAARRSGGLSYDKLRFDGYLWNIFHAFFDSVEQRPRGDLPHLLQRLSHGCQRRV